MKKFVSLMMAALMTLAVVALAACGGSGGSGDTFKGAFSEESYETEDEAIQAFLDEEISGDAVEAEFVSSREKSTLSSKQLNELERGDVLDSDETIVGGKIVEVTYRRSTEFSTYSVANTAAKPTADDDTFVFTVYVIEISRTGVTVHEFRYYVPKAETGDVLTRSYFEDVLDSEKYVNCTQEYTMTGKASTPGTSNINVSSTYTIEVANDRAMIKIHTVDPSVDITTTVQYIDIWVYCEENMGDIDFWASHDGGRTYIKAPYNPLAQYGVYDFEDFVSMNLPQYDYSFFEKTKNGFKLQDEFIQKYLADAIGQVGGPGISLDASLDIRVKDGRISEMNAHAKMSASYGGYSVSSESTEKLTFSKFGSTKVTKPSNITD